MENTDSILSDIQEAQIEASPLQKLLAYIIDFAIEILVILVIYITVPGEIISRLISFNTYSSYFVIFLLILAYRFICLLLFHKTVGMILSRIKYLNSNLQPLSAKQKLIAVVVTRTSAIKFYKVN